MYRWGAAAWQPTMKWASHQRRAGRGRIGTRGAESAALWMLTDRGQQPALLDRGTNNPRVRARACTQMRVLCGRTRMYQGRSGVVRVCAGARACLLDRSQASLSVDQSAIQEMIPT